MHLCSKWFNPQPNKMCALFGSAGMVGSGRDVMAMAKSGHRVRVFLMLTRMAQRLICPSSTEKCPPLPSPHPTNTRVQRAPSPPTATFVTKRLLDTGEGVDCVDPSPEDQHNLLTPRGCICHMVLCKREGLQNFAHTPGLSPTEARQGCQCLHRIT